MLSLNFFQIILTSWTCKNQTKRIDSAGFPAEFPVFSPSSASFNQKTKGSKMKNNTDVEMKAEFFWNLRKVQYESHIMMVIQCLFTTCIQTIDGLQD